MNTEMQNFKQAYEEIIKERKTIQAKAQKYDALKESWKKIKKEFSKKEKSNNWVHPEDSLIWREAIDIIDKNTEGLI